MAFVNQYPHAIDFGSTCLKSINRRSKTNLVLIMLSDDGAFPAPLMHRYSESSSSEI